MTPTCSGNRFSEKGAEGKKKEEASAAFVTRSLAAVRQEMRKRFVRRAKLHEANAAREQWRIRSDELTKKIDQEVHRRKVAERAQNESVKQIKALTKKVLELSGGLGKQDETIKTLRAKVSDADRRWAWLWVNTPSKYRPDIKRKSETPPRQIGYYNRGSN